MRSPWDRKPVTMGLNVGKLKQDRKCWTSSKHRKPHQLLHFFFFFSIFPLFPFNSRIKTNCFLCWTRNKRMYENSTLHTLLRAHLLEESCHSEQQEKAFNVGFWAYLPPSNRQKLFHLPGIIIINYSMTKCKKDNTKTVKAGKNLMRYIAGSQR